MHHAVLGHEVMSFIFTFFLRGVTQRHDANQLVCATIFVFCFGFCVHFGNNLCFFCDFGLQDTILLLSQ